MFTVPAFAPATVIVDDPLVGAAVVALLGREGHYTPIIEAPRLERPDALWELQRTLIAIRRCPSHVVVYAGRRDRQSLLLGSVLNDLRFEVVESADEADRRLSDLVEDKPSGVLTCRPTQLLEGLLHARLQHSALRVSQSAPSLRTASRREGHAPTHSLIVATSNPRTNLIAAEFAYACGASARRMTPISARGTDGVCELAGEERTHRGSLCWRRS